MTYKRETSQRYYLSPKGKEARRRSNQREAAKMQAVKIELVTLLGGGCTICGYNKSVAALHFDHLEPQFKVDNVGTLIGKKHFNRAREEIKKCRLLCANCHAEQTWPQLTISY